MTRRQRGVLIGAAAAVIVLVAAIVMVRAATKDDRLRTTAPSTTTTTLPALEPVPTAVPTTDSSLAPSTTTKPSVKAKVVIRTTSTTAATVPGAPILNGNGAVLRPPPAGTPARPMATKPDCHSLVDPGFSGSCGTANSRLGLLYWVVETRPGSWRAFVYRGDTPGAAMPMLQALDDDASTFSSIKVNVVDVSGDHADELVFGFHLKGSGAIVSMDIVEGHGVAVHRDYAQGSIRPSIGQIDAWGAVPVAGGSGGFSHEVIRAVQGAWRVVARTPVQQSEVPPPQV